MLLAIGIALVAVSLAFWIDGARFQRSFREEHDRLLLQLNALPKHVRDEISALTFERIVTSPMTRRAAWELLQQLEWDIRNARMRLR